MKALQAIGIVICILQAAILLQLRDLRPIRSDDLAKMAKSGNAQAFENEVSKIPVSTIYQIQNMPDVQVERLPAIEAKVDVQNEVRVRTGGETMNGEFYEKPLKVQIER